MDTPLHDVVLSAVAMVLDTTPSSLDLASSFIENRGDSLASIRLQSRLAEHGIQLSLSSVFTAKTLLDLLLRTTREGHCRTANDLGRESVFESTSTVGRGKRRCSSFSARDHHGIHTKRVCAKRQPVDKANARYPLTEMQLSMIRSTQNNPGRNVILYIERHSPENLPALKDAWQHALGSEEIFNMRFEVDDNGGHMVPDKMPFVWDELCVGDEATYEREASNFSPVHGMSVSSGFKAVILRTDTRSKCMVIWRIHHAMIDGVSFSRVRSKVRDLLAGKEISRGSGFSEFCLQFHSLQARLQSSARWYWEGQRTKHRSPAAVLQFPALSKDRPARQSLQGQISISSNTKRLSAFARDNGGTLASLYYAAWGLVLSRFTDSESICFGAVLSGVSLPIKTAATVIGPTINTLPLNISIDLSQSLEEYLGQVFASLLELTDYQFSTPADGFTREFESVVNVHLETPEFTGAPHDPLESPCVTVLSDFPLQVDIGRCGKITISYDEDLFLAENIGLLGRALCSVLDSMAGSTVAPHDSIVNTPLPVVLESILDSQQLLELRRLGNWDGFRAREPAVGQDHDTLVTLFFKVAREFRSEVAVEQGPNKISYGELDEKSSIVARYLTSVMCIRPGDVICVHADGTPCWIIAIYGTLKAGAIYCPLDPSLPESVRSRNYDVSGAVTFICSDDNDASTTPPSCKMSISVQKILSSTGTFPNPPDGVTNSVNSLDSAQAGPNSAAYICFTSGSSGIPKAVLCRHGGLVAFQKDPTVRLKSSFPEARSGRRWKIAQFMSPGFDGSIHEIFSALSYGSTLVLRDGSSDPFAHLRKCDAAILTPTVAAALDPADFPRLKAVYLVGEAVSQSVCDVWASASSFAMAEEDQCRTVGNGNKLEKKPKEIYNMYGPTEATCGATIKKLEFGGQVTLGRPNPSTRVYILDKSQRLAPRGVIGEIYLAGVQVALGYIGREEETSARFFHDGVCTEFKGERMYKTGDRGYWDENGELVCLGRTDRQIKLRGFRIDLDDLEMQIVKIAALVDPAGLGISGVAVVTTNASDGSLDGVVAVVKPATVDLHKLELKMKEQLPSYARPMRTLAIGEFPVSRAGKTDYRAMEAMVSSGQKLGRGDEDGEKHTAARKVADIVGEVLALPRGVNVTVNMESSFTELGGNSILALNLARRLSQHVRLRVPVKMVLSSASILELVGKLTDLDGGRMEMDGMLTNQMVLGDGNVSPIETEWWNKYNSSLRDPFTSCFNVTYACHLPATVDKKRLASAWHIVIGRHPILRSEFKFSPSLGKLARQYSDQPFFTSCPDNIDIRREANSPFDLNTGEPLIRVFISNTQMLVVISHIICDLATLTQLLRELSLAYRGKDLPAVARTYAQTTTWSTRASACNLAFWDGYLGNRTTPPSSSKNKIAQHRKTWAGTSHLAEIPDPVHQCMIRFVSIHKITMHQLALAATALAVHTIQDTNTNENGMDITLGAPYLNRGPDEETVIGLFLEPLPIRIQYPPRQRHPTSTLSYIKTVQESSLSALSHAIPWDQLLSHFTTGKRPPHLRPNKDNTIYPISDNPFFDTMVTFHEKEHNPANMFSLSRLPNKYYSADGSSKSKKNEQEQGPELGETPKFIPTCAEGAKFPLMVEFSQSASLVDTTTTGVPPEWEQEQEEDLVGPGALVAKRSVLEVRLEYSTEMFSVGQIRVFERLLVAALEGLTCGLDFETLMRRLRDGCRSASGSEA